MKGKGKKARKAASGKLKPRKAGQAPSSPAESSAAGGTSQTGLPPVSIPQAPAQAPAEAPEPRPANAANDLEDSRQRAASAAIEKLESLRNGPGGDPPRIYEESEVGAVGAPLAEHLRRGTSGEREHYERAAEAHRRMREEFVETSGERLAAQAGQVGPERAVELALIEEGYKAARNEEKAAGERFAEARRREALAVLSQVRSLGAKEGARQQARPPARNYSQRWAAGSHEEAVAACESALAHFPSEWVAESAEHSPMRAVGLTRHAYYQPGANAPADQPRLISVPASESLGQSVQTGMGATVSALDEVQVRANAVHELTHRFEESRPHLIDLGKQFLARRQAEHGGDGGFSRPYASFTYDSGRTEVLACGFEEMFKGGREESNTPRGRPAGGLYDDPDYEAFVLGAAASA